jgi:hypothetical protein
MPILRHTSASFVPTFRLLKCKRYCCSVNFDLFIGQPSSTGHFRCTGTAAISPREIRLARLI